MDSLDELKKLLPLCLLYDQVRVGSRLAVLLRERTRPESFGREVETLLGAARRSAETRALREARRPALKYAEGLPVAARRAEIVEAIRRHPVVVIAGETGSGKTTQIPKMCLEAGCGSLGRIGCTQPRRVAALSISRRVAEELDVRWGAEIGCKIRFADDTARETVVKFMTDGILLAEVQGDPNLTEYDAIVIDEAHERSLNIDFLLGHLRQLIERRPDLKLIITSATIDTARFSQAFGGAPIIEVSGRVYPVEVRYAPLDEQGSDNGDQTYIDAAATSIEDILTSSSDGDILVFLPGEGDIRELKDLLVSRDVRGVDLIPFFGRLSGADQQRAFAGGGRRKVILATNIAETSITLPGIRYVIDSGLARISRYNPRTRTKRLPVEPVSRSSANQRKGRSGRVADGVCIRLYSQEDFDARPEFTQPEIQRANLAEVILRMKSARLGEIETFPFLEVPSPAAIRAGYDLLRELGALDEARNLTPLGESLARLPVDPTIARIVLQSSREGVLEEVLVIAAGLSIQDPRERPFEEAASAHAAHRRFQNPTSDFLTLLNLWDAFHDQWERLRTQNLLRKFCKSNFLSYLRMREWVDIHAQLAATFHEAVGERWFERDDDDTEDAPASPAPAAAPAPVPNIALRPQDPRYHAVHRSVLAGLLGHVAQKAERNVYKASGARQVSVFPGSALHERQVAQPPAARGRQQGGAAATPPVKSTQPEWIVAGEMVETSRLFARTLAGIQPEWILELGGHLCKRTHHHPHWDAAAGQVVARERITFQGLEIADHKVAYGPIAPAEATAIFIRSALVEEGWDGSGDGPDDEDLLPGAAAGRSLRKQSAPAPRRRWQLHNTGFLEHNRAVVHRIRTWQTRTRHHGLRDLDESLLAFYSDRIQSISSIHELNELLRGRLPAEADFLRASEKDLAGDLQLNFDANAFPETFPLGQQTIPIAYNYAPGEEHDGPSLQVPLGLLTVLREAQVAWSVPGLREEQVMCLLRELPKALRRDLQPFAPKVVEIAREFRPAGDSFLDELAVFVSRKYGVVIPQGTWNPEHLPNHLRPRVEVMGPNRKLIMAGRDIKALEQRCITVKAPDLDALWNRACSRWEKFGFSTWSIGSVPERVEEKGPDGGALVAFTGLKVEDGEVCLRLFRRAQEAAASTPHAWALLLERQLSRELAWVHKDLKSLDRFRLLHATLGSGDELVESALLHLKRHLFPAPARLDEAAFQEGLVLARERMKGLVPPFVDRVGLVLQKRQELLACRKPYAGLSADLELLLPRRFLEHTPFEQLNSLVRYLKGMQIRAERAGVNPVRDAERARLIEPYLRFLTGLRAASPGGLSGAALRFRWLVEEYRVSLFAQELGTAEPVSPKRLDALMKDLS